MVRAAQARHLARRWSSRWSTRWPSRAWCPTEDAAAIRDRASFTRRGGQGARAGHRPRRGRVRGRGGRARSARPGAGCTTASPPRTCSTPRSALQLSQAGLILVGGARATTATRSIRRAREHVDTLCVGRTHGVHAEPTTFGVKLAGFAFEARPQPAPARARGRGRVGGRAVRRRGHLRRQRPGGRGGGAEAARARARGRLDPGGAARPPRRAAVGDRAGRRGPRALRHRDPPPPAHRGARGRGAVPRRRPEGLVGDAAQAQPDRERADHRHRPAAARLRADRARERGALARARHLALVGRAGGAARTRRSCSTTRSTWRSGWWRA